MATQSVYNYCRQRQGLGVIGIKGSSQSGKPAIGRGSRVDLNYRGRAIKKGVIVYMVGSDTIKDVLFARLKFNNKLHFHAQTTEEWFKQFTGERRVLKKNGRGTEYVQKKNQNVEALDCAVYAFAALNHLYQRHPRGKIYEIFDKKRLNSIKSDKRSLIDAKLDTSAKQSYVTNW
jgi:phage terminase large subunit GpA-like protein